MPNGATTGDQPRPGGTYGAASTVRSVRGMTSLLRLGAGCGVLSGSFIALPGAVEAFTGETAPTSFVIGLSPALAVPLLMALHLAQLRAAGRLGAVGFAVNVVGLGLFGGAAFTLNLVLFYLDDAVVDDLAVQTRLALLGSAAVFVVGSVLFGLAMIRAKVHPRPAAWIYTIALPVFALAAPLPDSPLTSAVHVVVGATLVWLSVTLLDVREGSEAWLPAAAASGH